MSHTIDNDPCLVPVPAPGHVLDALRDELSRGSLLLHLPPSAVPLVSDVRFRRSAQRLARLTAYVGALEGPVRPERLGRQALRTRPPSYATPFDGDLRVEDEILLLDSQARPWQLEQDLQVAGITDRSEIIRLVRTDRGASPGACSDAVWGGVTLSW